MFSTRKFVAASRNFVCVRLETYERKEHQDLIRKFLNGRMENTAFCILDPNGEEQLTRSGRSPASVLGAEGRGPGARKGSNEDVISEMDKLSSEFRPRGDDSEMVLQDFHSYRQALNVASGDQRLLVFIAAGERDQETARDALEPVFADEEVIGRFHLDFGNAEKDSQWASSLKKLKSKSGIIVIQSHSFGQEGEVLRQLPITAKGADIKTALLLANEEFAASEERKVYSDHIAEGRREGIFFETELPFGEDRDGDGVIDSRRGKGKEKG